METRKRFEIRFSIPAVHTNINWRAWLPTRGNVVFTVLIVMVLFGMQSARVFSKNEAMGPLASTGTWPYQGRLANSAGAPITDTVPMIFRLYNAPGDGVTPLWEEQWTGPNSVQVSDGLFNVMLGSLTPINQSIVTGNGTLWLGITAGTDDEMKPRVQLGSVPYSVQALTVPDGSISNPKLADAAVSTLKLADGAVTQAKIADGSVTQNKIANGSVTQAKLGSDISLTPPDGSIATAKLANGAVTRAKLAPSILLQLVQTGQVSGNGDPNYRLNQGSGDRIYTYHVNFNIAYSNTPTVTVAICNMDVDKAYNLRVDVYAQNVTNTGFDLTMKTWGDSKIYLLSASWVAVGLQ